MKLHLDLLSGWASRSNFLLIIFIIKFYLTLLLRRISEAEAKKMKNKVIIESQSIYNLGIHADAFDPSNVIMIEKDDAWFRVSKPRDGKPKVVILWSKDNKDDTTPLESKIVCIWHPYILPPSFLNYLNTVRSCGL